MNCSDHNTTGITYFFLDASHGDIVSIVLSKRLVMLNNILEEIRPDVYVPLPGVRVIHLPYGFPNANDLLMDEFTKFREIHPIGYVFTEVQLLKEDVSIIALLGSYVKSSKFKFNTEKVYADIRQV